MNEQDAKESGSPWGDVVHRYTRAQALADGVLVDVSEVGHEAGFRWPVAVTDTVWSDCVAWSEHDNAAQTYQDEAGGLWDVVYMAAVAVRQAPGGGATLCYDFLRIPRDGRARESELVTLKLEVGPGDAGEPVVTIMLPNES